MAEISDEDRLIRILKLHKALKLWTIAILLEAGIAYAENVPLAEFTDESSES